MKQHSNREENGEERVLLSHLTDLIHAAGRRGRPCYSSFLTEHEQATAQRLLGNDQAVVWLWGGYPDAERQVFAAAPFQFSPTENDYPFEGLTILMPKGYTVSHRDVLGALMALGIKRETLGDLLVGERYTVLFAMRPVVELILNELLQIGRVSVQCQRGIPEVLPLEQKTEAHEDLVASMRLDCIVAMVAKVSRSESARLIEQGLVSCNAQPITALIKEVGEGDKISIRKMGKFQITQVGGITKKGKLRVSYLKYC